MRTLEVGRHSLVKDHVHPSQAGVDLARRVGAASGPFDRVMTSRIPRTLETAVALGFAVHEQLEILGKIEPDVWAEIGHHERWGMAGTVRHLRTPSRGRRCDRPARAVAGRGVA